MNKKEHEEQVERAIRTREMEIKIDRDDDALAGYERRLRQARKVYARGAETYTTGGEKNRAYALGACIMGLVKEMEKDSAEHRLIMGTVTWQIAEDRVVDPDGKKGYRYNVAVRCLEDHDAYTEDEIRGQVEETQQKMIAETKEMFSDVLPAGWPDSMDVPVEETIQ